MTQSIYGNHRTSYTIRTPSAIRGPQTLTVESRSRDGGSGAGNFLVNLSVPIQCETNQAIGYYLKEAHLPLANWTVNKGYDSFQMAFPYADTNIYTVNLKHGTYTCAEFALMVQDALNIVTFDPTTGDYKRHVHSWTDYETDGGLKAMVDAAVLEYNTEHLPKRMGSAVTADVTITAADGLSSPISFSVDYNTSQNRFSISRTDVGRLYKTGQFDIAIESYQLAKAFGCPWGAKFNTATTILDGGHPTYYKNSDDTDMRFYVPQAGPSHTGQIRDDSGTWDGQSLGKTFEHRHLYYLLSSEKWSGTSTENLGINAMNQTLSPSDGSVIPHVANHFPSICEDGTHVDSDKIPMSNWFAQTLLMPYPSRIRGDDCFYIRSSLFGGESIQTNHGGGGSNCLQMIKVDKSPGEIMFWSPTYTPEPHIITRRDIPSISFKITDKDHREVDFNGEEVVLELEFITYDIVSIPLHRQEEGERFVAPHSYAPDYSRRQFSQPLQGNSHMPSGFGNYR